MPKVTINDQVYEVEKGKTFTCSVKLKKGEEQTATLEILNEDADVSVTNLRPANE